MTDAVAGGACEVDWAWLSASIRGRRQFCLCKISLPINFAAREAHWLLVCMCMFFCYLPLCGCPPRLFAPFVVACDAASRIFKYSSRDASSHFLRACTCCTLRRTVLKSALAVYYNSRYAASHSLRGARYAASRIFEYSSRCFFVFLMSLYMLHSSEDCAQERTCCLFQL